MKLTPTKNFKRLLRPLLSKISYCRGKSGHSQLQMQLENLNNIPKNCSLPSGYSIRTYREGDEPHWIRIIQEAFGKNLGEPPQITLKNILKKPDFDSKSLFFAIYEKNQVGTICAVTLPFGHTKTGYIHMFGVSPNHQNEKVGRGLACAVLQYFKKKGVQHVILDTDDFRIPAIKIYLNLGFKPVYFDLSHRKRWFKILKDM